MSQRCFCSKPLDGSRRDRPKTGHSILGSWLSTARGSNHLVDVSDRFHTYSNLLDQLQLAPSGAAT
jgi:hypothetical protein